jgi:2-hydroxychromene-2-carboxylate isomerase
MQRRIEFFYDYGSPFSYLADRRLVEIAERTGAGIVYRPMLLGGVFKATGNRSPAQEPIAAKQAYGGLHLRRSARAYGVAFEGNPHFPINTLMLMRTAVAAQQLRVFEIFHRAVYPAFWRDGLDLGDAVVLAALLERAGLDPGALAARRERDDVKTELRATTEEAVARGAFGAPTFFLSAGASASGASADAPSEMFFGADHLFLLERVLSDS